MRGLTCTKYSRTQRQARIQTGRNSRPPLNHVRAGDMFVVHSMDRLARNVEDKLRLVREMNDRGVSVEFIKENMSFTAGSEDPRSILRFTMLSAFAQFERSLIKERQREG